MQSLIKDLSADNVCKLSEQSAEKNVSAYLLVNRKDTNLEIPTAQVINNDAKSMLLKH